MLILIKIIKDKRKRLLFIVAREKRKKETEICSKQNGELMDEMKVLSVARISGKYALWTD
jgi:hypothetical protein